jgi:tetratricopeptide (TPR) repeat protein
MEPADEDSKNFFESAKSKAESDVKRNPKDTGALTRWGGALLELANFMPGEEASDMVDAAVSKFQQALTMDPKKHDALWCLGNAYTSQGFLSAQKEAAEDLFRKAEVRCCTWRSIHECD